MREGLTTTGDQQLLKAHAAVRAAARKLKRLGYSDEDAMELMRTELSSKGTNRQQQSTRSRIGREGRIKRAQEAIRRSMKAGCSESDIANLVAVSPSAIAHILAPDDHRSASERLVLRLEALAPKVSVLATCNSDCARIDNTTTSQLEDIVTVALSRGIDKVRFPKGISAFLAAVGNPFQPLYVILIEKPLSLEHLKQLEHEVDHILDSVRDRIEQVGSKDRKDIEVPSDGAFA
ncbi:MAG TPA: hypothetical protein VFI24_28545 [Pyrinomonadaceae bacterium]|nr:hypothetical protein [Pyrinomonadaceae bacterium]